MDLAVINAWLLYLRTQKQRGIPDGESIQLKLADFRLDLAETLCSYGSYEKNKRGWPSNELATRPAIKKRKNVSSTPSNNIKFDQLSHWPVHIEESC